MNKIEIIALEKLKGQLHSMRKRFEEATKIMDTINKEQFNGQISISQIHIIGDVNRALETIYALEENNEIKK